MSDVEKNTNELLRKKYFVDSANVLGRKRKIVKTDRRTYSKIIDASKAVFSGQPVPVRVGGKSASDSIKVNVRRTGEKITGISISCPCGRHAELDCEYA